MSADEDTELRDLVAQSLAANGVLGKIRAELRANVFLALEEQESIQNKTPFLNPVLKSFLSTKEGQLVTGLVREFLEFFNLEFSIAVFEPESDYKSENYGGRKVLARELGVTESESTMNLPLLSQIVKGTSGNNMKSHSDSKIVRELAAKDNSETKLSFSSGTNSTSSSTSKNHHVGHHEGDEDPFFDDPLPGFDRSNKNKDVQDEDYEDDFDSSNISPRGATPRTAKSDAAQSDTDLKSMEEEIDEEIEEELSIAEDLLKSDPSEVDDLTTDRTVSPTEQSSAFDYIEDVLVP